MSWYKVEFSSIDFGKDKHLMLKQAFERLFTTFNAPKELALFGQKEGQGYVVYFSPDSDRYVKALIENFSGVVCPPPQLADLEILVGHVDAKIYMKYSKSKSASEKLDS